MSRSLRSLANEARATHAVNSRARTKQERGEIKEIRSANLKKKMSTFYQVWGKNQLNSDLEDVLIFAQYTQLIFKICLCNKTISLMDEVQI